MQAEAAEAAAENMQDADPGLRAAAGGGTRRVAHGGATAAAGGGVIGGGGATVRIDGDAVGRCDLDRDNRAHGGERERARRL